MEGMGLMVKKIVHDPLDDRREASQSMLDAYPSLQKMYSADDGNTEVFYFKNATATFS